MRKKLAIAGFFIFVLASGGGLWLLLSGKLSGTEFVSFVVVFTIISGIVVFAPEVQEISVAGNVVKLREVKNDAIKSIEVLKRSQAELLRLMLRTKSFIIRAWFQSPDKPAIDADFWDIVAEIKRIEAVDFVRAELVACIDRMLPELYQVAVGPTCPWREGFWIHKNIVDVAADLLDPKMLLETSKLLGHDDESIYKDFAKLRILEMKRLYELKDSLLAN
ncbi:hypothetical protein [Pseudomonas sp. Irchel 3H7]|uniref:hypothetical protein n=1 Tax=Pseudomonas sp. Irchel 3H7 TaxID=2009042 RepID=UPI000BA2F80C|nr:hypothetical protein [Pseudomonas sp. Irchel 3H7]